MKGESLALLIIMTFLALLIGYVIGNYYGAEMFMHTFCTPYILGTYMVCKGF